MSVHPICRISISAVPWPIRRSLFPPAIAARVALINGQFSLEDDQIAFMGRARTILSEAARQIVESLPDHYDVGRTIAALDMVQNAKDALLSCHPAAVQAPGHDGRASSDVAEEKKTE